MGHYDNCREGNCPVCGQALGVLWGCGREGCTTYHQFLAKEGRHKELECIMKKLRLQNEAEEEERVTARQIKRTTAAIARQARKEAEA